MNQQFIFQYANIVFIKYRASLSSIKNFDEKIKMYADDDMREIVVLKIDR